MELRKELAKIWQHYEIKSRLPSILIERKYAFFENRLQKDILFLGLNPFFIPENGSAPKRYDLQDLFQYILVESRVYESYFKPVKESIKDNFKEIDLTNEIAYADLFYYRTSSQGEYFNLLSNSKKGKCFLQDQFYITQCLIEKVIQPKVIIISHLEVLMYIDSGFVKDYNLKRINNTLSGFNVYEVGSNNKLSNLIGSRIIFVPNLFTENNSLLSAQDILNELYKVNKTKGIQTNKSYLKVDYSFFITYPLLYKQYMTPKLKAKDEQVILNLKFFKTCSFPKMVKIIIEHLFQENVLCTKEIIKLSSLKYCKKELGIQNVLLKKESKNKITPNELCFVKTNEYFVLNDHIELKQQTTETKEKLERWYVRKMCKHFDLLDNKNLNKFKR